MLLLLLPPLLELGAVVSITLWEELAAEPCDLQRRLVSVIHNLLETGDMIEQC